MADRLYSWPCDNNGYSVQCQSQPIYATHPSVAAPICATEFNPNRIINNNNNNVGVGDFRYFGPPGIKYPTGYSTTTTTTGIGGGGGPMGPTQMDICQYAHLNGSASCYNRYRYMPYNHNRSCAAAAAIANVTGQPIVSHQSMVAVQQQQQQQQHPFAPIYQQQQQPSLNTPSIPSVPIALTPSTVQLPTVVSSAAAPTTTMSAATTSVGLPDYSYGNGLINTLAPSHSMVSLASSATIGEITGHNYGSVNGVGVGDTCADAVTLQITNLDFSLDEASLRHFLLNQLKPITPVVSLIFEGTSYAKVTVPDLYFAKQVVSNLHRKKIGHKRMLVSYTRDSSLTEVNTLRCQVAGLLKDVPYYTLPMYKFRELFQSRFKTSISVLDLYKMQDICTINSDNNEDKFISLQPELVNTLESSPLMEGLQHSVPFCTAHFKREQHKGWAEQDIEPLPNVFMTIAEIQKLIYPLLKHHPGDIPIATLVHCIEGQLQVQIEANESGVNLEHLICCVQGIQIQVNNFGIKILGWLELNKDSQVSGAATGTSNANATGNNTNLSGGERPNGGGSSGSNGYFKNSTSDPLYQISREVIELVKMSPKATMKFNRFIPAYHNHFGKQCRVADYGYTKLIELFEALSTVVQIMGDGENRQITLTHRTQIRRFTSDLLRVLRAHNNNSVLLSQLPVIFAQTHNRSFDVTDYGVCDITDILDGLENSNIVVVSSVQQGKDILISIPKRKQTSAELEKTSVFAGEMVELFRNALQYTILFQKFVRSYHYHFAYQCRLSDYGFLKLADLMDSINGIVELELNNDEDKKICLAPKVARRVFAEQCGDLIRNVTGNSTSCLKLEQIFKMHKKKYGYQMLPQTLGTTNINKAIEMLPYVEVVQKEQTTWLICHNDDMEFRQMCYRACKQLLQREGGNADNSQISTKISKAEFVKEFNERHQKQLTDSSLLAIQHAIEVYIEDDEEYVRLSGFMRFVVSIVRLLEQRPTMFVHEIKTTLDCGLSRTFEFGFPNIYSIVVAHEDLFAINEGPSQERTEVTLTVNCELRQSGGSSHQHLFGSLKLPFAKHKARAASSRTPLSEHNRPAASQAPPPHKTRAIANEYVNSIGGSSNAYKPQVNTTSSSQSTSSSSSSYFQTYQEHFQPLKCSPPLGGNHCGSKIQPSANSSLICSSLLNTTNPNNNSNPNLSLCSSCNKENSLNSSLHLFSSSLNSSSELSSSLSGEIHSAMASSTGISTYPQNSKLWQRRQARFYIEQQQSQQSQQSQFQQQPLSQSQSQLGLRPRQQLMVGCMEDAQLLMPPPPSSNTGGGGVGTGGGLNDLYDLVSCNIAPISSIYEPPKPDTPPSEKLPFWIDPVWSNQSEPPRNNNLLNIRLPEIKPLNVLPMLLSPYTLSKHENMKRQLFNVDNHDRKIA